MSINGVACCGIADLFLGLNFLLGWSSESRHCLFGHVHNKLQMQAPYVRSEIKDYVTSSCISFIGDSTFYHIAYCSFVVIVILFLHLLNHPSFPCHLL